MRVICAWCEKEGIETILGIIEGPHDLVSHGMCERHQEEMLQEIEKIKPSKQEKNPRHRRRHRR